MKAPVLLHIGTSRTATTTLQNNVFVFVPEIIFLGKPFPHKRGQVIDNHVSQAESELLTRVVTQIVRLPGDQNMETELAKVRSIIDRLKESKEGAIVCSDELLSNNKYVSYRVIAERLRSAFGPADIMITIRNQFSVLPSLYLHEMRRSMEPVDFSDWLDQALADPTARNRWGESIEQYRYDTVLESFSESFSNRIGVFFYEELVADQANYAARIAEFIGADATRIEALLAAPAKNPSKSAVWYRYRRRYVQLQAILPIRLIDNLPGAAWIKRAVKARLEANAALEPPVKVVLSAQDRERIEAYYAADNRALAKRLGMDLRARSYPGCTLEYRSGSGQVHLVSAE